MNDLNTLGVRSPHLAGLVIQRASRFAWGMILLVAACSPGLPPAAPAVSSSNPLPVTIESQPLVAPQTACTGVFVPHNLDHSIQVARLPVQLFDSNGAGLAINDLNNDGLLDVVLANLDGPNAIFWNRGGLAFQKEALPIGDTRSVSIVDVDGDGWQDIVFSRRRSRPEFWRNGGGATSTVQFLSEELPNVTHPAYAMNWGDLNGDERLDLVTASYDVDQVLPLFETTAADETLSGGVYYYAQGEDTFIVHGLVDRSEGLALALIDLNSDGLLDIMVGNDFAGPDYIWLQQETGWVAASPFSTTTENTMSFDVGDINNDGHAEIFATDMKPYDRSPEILADWLPMMQTMAHPTSATDPQLVENVLQVRGADGRFHNQGYERFVDATGWSWSSKFGDLDNDGFLDIYVVNGMIAHDFFDHLPGNELKEQNQALRNRGDGHFVRAPEWGLGSTAGGRGMSLADLDNDGDLDVVVNNLGSPAQIFENQLCGGSSLEVDLFWPASRNVRAIGAQLGLRTSLGNYYRDVRASSGYLSGDPARVHFGFPEGAQILGLDIVWPDGRISSVPEPDARTLLIATRE